MLDIENIKKVFQPGTVNQNIVLDELSLHMEEGEFITVIGNNGAGKSTLLNCISGVIPIDTGRITLNGVDITKLPEHKKSKNIGRVFQDPLKGTAFDMTIEENLSLAYNRKKSLSLVPGVSKKDREFYIQELKKLEIGLENRLNEKVRFLSGGQRQALTLLMAVISQPKLLLLDEHTAALDPNAAQKILSLTASITKETNLTTLMITHNMKDALKYGTRTVFLNSGKVVLDIKGKERSEMTVDELVEKFKIESDKMLL